MNSTPTVSSMAKGGLSMFMEEDDDEVNTTTTEEDYDPNKEYDVECVLAEQFGEDGKWHYLIKWEGYALYDCTWETRDSITSEVVLRHWEADKRLIKSGQKQPFDVEDYYKAFEEHAEKQERKRNLRKKKRKRRGQLVASSNDDEDSTSSFDLPTTETPKSTRAKVTSPTKKKGVAQPVSKRRNTFSKDISQEDEDRPAAQRSDVDSLFGEPIERTAAPTPSKPKQSTTSTSTTKSVTSTPKNTESSKVTSATEKSHSVQPAQGVQNEQRRSSASSTTAITTSARKSAPAGTVGTAKPASKANVNVFANWTKDKRPRQRQRVSGETAKDSTDPKFTHLSVQNKFQKYSRNEPAPNPNSLIMIDPKTGKTQPPKTPSVRNGPEDIHSVYGRRSPTRTRQRTPSPPSPPRPRPNEAPSRLPSLTDSNVESQDLRSLERPKSGHAPKISATCQYWKEGTCMYTAETCRFIHAEVPPGKKPVTCHYWAKDGSCKRTAEECEFCHFWLPEVAGPPGTFRKTIPAVNFPASDVNRMRITSPVDQTFTPLSPVEQFDGTVKTFQQPAIVHRAHQSPITIPEPITDPRLRGRATRVSEGNTGPPETPTKRGQLEQIDATSMRLSPDVDMTDAMNMSHGTPEQDLAMARLGIAKLNPLKLLKYNRTTENKEIDIQYVYIHMPDRPDELELLRDYFKGLNRQVYTSKEVGAWALFSNSYPSKGSLLVVHPTELFTGTISGLYSLLAGYGASFSVFSIGVQHARCIRENRKPAYESLRLFPQANFTFISDDVFVYFPDKATQIIDKFLEDYKAHPKAAQFSKIGARPGIKDWLLRLAYKKMEEHAGDGDAIPNVKVYDAICRLCPLEDEDPNFPEKHIPLDSSQLWSPSAESLPSFKGRWESGDEEGATDSMANFFAGEACSKAWKYRKFHFVYQRPEHDVEMTDSQGKEEEKAEDPQGWRERYSHIGIVTPGEVLKLKKKG